MQDNLKKQIVEYAESLLLSPSFETTAVKSWLSTIELCCDTPTFLSIMQEIAVEYSDTKTAVNVGDRIAEMILIWLQVDNTPLQTAEDLSKLSTLPIDVTKDILHLLSKVKNSLSANRLKLMILKAQTKPSCKVIAPVSIKFARENRTLLQRPEKVAQSLSIIDWRIFVRLDVTDFLKSKSELSKSSLLHSLQQRFNKMSNWVATKILTCDKRQLQVALIQSFIQIANKLHKLHNYNTMAMILMGLNVHPISRLKSIWNKVAKEHMDLFDALNDKVSPQHNYSSYRRAIDDPTVVPKNAALFPYIPVLLRDVLYIKDNYKDSLRNGELDFESLNQLGAILQQIRVHQHAGYQLLRSDNGVIDEVLATHFEALPGTIEDDDELYNLSIKSLPCKQPSTNVKSRATSIGTTEKISEIAKIIQLDSKSFTDSFDSTSTTTTSTSNSSESCTLLSSWTVAATAKWATTLNTPDFDKIILFNKIDGKMLGQLDATKLSSLGVKKKKHQQEIVIAIAELLQDQQLYHPKAIVARKNSWVNTNNTTKKNYTCKVKHLDKMYTIDATSFVNMQCLHKKLKKKIGKKYNSKKVSITFKLSSNSLLLTDDFHIGIMFQIINYENIDTFLIVINQL